MDFLALLGMIVSLLLLLVTGYLCRRIGIVDDHSAKKFSRLIIEIGQPALIISALINAEYSTENLGTVPVAFGVSLLLHAFFAVFAYFTAKALRDPGERKMTEYSVIFANCGFIGLPILQSMFGSRGLFLGVFNFVTFNLLIWTWGIVVLGRGREDIRLTVKRALINFGTVPGAIGIGLYLSHLPLPSFVYTFSSYLSNLCTPISVIVTGALIATKPLKSLFFDGKLYYQSFLKLIALPLLTALLAKGVTVLFRVPDAETWILFCTVVAALPSASTVTMMAERYGLERADFASQAVGLSSVLSLGTLPLTVWLAHLIAGI